MQAARSLGLPARIAFQPDALYVALRDIAPQELHDPFMQETINRVPAPDTVIRIPRAGLGEEVTGTAPAGLIFHVARCGSTLVSQLLKQQGQVVVYAEPLPVNDILVPPHKWERAELIAALRVLGGLFARHAGRPYVLKLTSWNTLFCELAAEAFPATPWALVVREPVEVCVSLLEQRPGWLRDAPASNLFADIVDPARSSRSAEEYVARLYAAFCEAASRLDTARASLIHYETLPDTVWNLLAPRFGLAIHDEVRRRMSAASRAYSKSPVGKPPIAFAPDNARKRAAASTELSHHVDAFARPALARLVAGFADR